MKPLSSEYCCLNLSRQIRLWQHKHESFLHRNVDIPYEPQQPQWTFSYSLLTVNASIATYSVKKKNDGSGVESAYYQLQAE